MSKKLGMTVVVVGAVLALGATAYAGGWGRGYGQGPGWAYYQQLTPEQRTQIDKTRAQFLQDTLGLRQKIAAKGAELNTMMAQPNADKAKIKALADELVDLRAELAKKGNEQLSQLPAGYGMGRGRMGGFGAGWR